MLNFREVFLLILAADALIIAFSGPVIVAVAVVVMVNDGLQRDVCCDAKWASCSSSVVACDPSIPSV